MLYKQHKENIIRMAEDKDILEGFEISSPSPLPSQRALARRRKNVDIHDSDGTDSSDLDEYDEELDSVGSLEDFVVDGSSEESDYECSEEIIESDFDSSDNERDEGEVVQHQQRRSQRLGARRFQISNINVSSDSDSDYVPE